MYGAHQNQNMQEARVNGESGYMNFLREFGSNNPDNEGANLWKGMTIENRNNSQMGFPSAMDFDMANKCPESRACNFIPPGMPSLVNPKDAIPKHFDDKIVADHVNIPLQPTYTEVTTSSIVNARNREKAIDKTFAPYNPRRNGDANGW